MLSATLETRLKGLKEIIIIFSNPLSAYFILVTNVSISFTTIAMIMEIYEYIYVGVGIFTKLGLYQSKYSSYLVRSRYLMVFP